ncbi:Na+/H+ antiporter subunit E [Kineococcus sp. SYSU DK004]|uniref:Na+/H+ antiporter subunit E n=1 Tax=Kineococcus sp. SYSU DK004 TaxID=3383125 RepID=UPI003D7CC141
MTLRLPLAVAMLLAWFALWGRVTVLNAVGGVLVVLVLRAAFPMPGLPTTRRLSPVGLAVLAGYVAADLVRSSLQMAWLSVRPGPTPRSGIVAVRLRDSSDVVVVTVSQLLTLVPGTLTVDVDVPTGTLYVHVPVTGPVEEVPEAVRRQVHALERRVVRAVGAAPPRDARGAGEEAS